jgi:hypothetical protein
MSSFRIQTAQTNALPFSLVSKAFEEELLKSREIAFYSPSQDSAVTAMPVNLLRGAAHRKIWELTTSDFYPESYIFGSIARTAGSHRSSFLKSPHHGRRAVPELIRAGPTGSVNVLSMGSATDPAANTVELVVSTVDASTASRARELSSNVLSLQRAIDYLAKAKAAARSPELRAAYHSLFRGLDILLNTGRWDRVSSELRDLCANQYPISFAIGALRFCSSASSQIPGWEVILQQAIKTARQQNVDVSRAMRGLLESNAAK